MTSSLGNLKASDKDREIGIRHPLLARAGFSREFQKRTRWFFKNIGKANMRKTSELRRVEIEPNSRWNVFNDEWALFALALYKLHVGLSWNDSWNFSNHWSIKGLELEQSHIFKYLRSLVELLLLVMLEKRWYKTAFKTLFSLAV